MLCGKCGAALPAQARFCTQCGGVVSEPQILGKRHHRGVAVLVLVAVLALVAVLIALCRLGPKTEDLASCLYSRKSGETYLCQGMEKALLLEHDSPCKELFTCENDDLFAFSLENSQLYWQKSGAEPILAAEHARGLKLEENGNLYYLRGGVLYRFDGEFSHEMARNIGEKTWLSEDQSTFYFTSQAGFFCIALSPEAQASAICREGSAIGVVGNAAYYVNQKSDTVWLSDLVTDALAESDGVLTAPEDTDETAWAAYEAAMARSALRKALRAERVQAEFLTLYGYEHGKSFKIAENLAQVKEMNGEIFYVESAYTAPRLDLQDVEDIADVRREAADPRAGIWRTASGKSIHAPGALGELEAAHNVGKILYLRLGGNLYRNGTELAKNVRFSEVLDGRLYYLTEEKDVLTLWCDPGGRVLENISNLWGAYAAADGRLYYLAAEGPAEVAEGDFVLIRALPDGRALALDHVDRLYLLEGEKARQLDRRVRTFSGMEMPHYP